MLENPDQSLSNAMNFIQLQMFELAKDCSNTVQDGMVTMQYVLQVQDRLDKILQETRAVCTPPKRQPVMADFKTLKCLGRGAFGTVNLVRHKETGLNLAMKMIHRLRVTEETKDNLLMERDILAFSDNPYVVSLFCTFQTERHFCMAMEYAGGGDCEGLLMRNKRLPLELARTYVAETTLALEYIHSYGIIHADLKPGNLLISSTGHIKLADFGMSKIGPVNMTVDKRDLREKAIEFTGPDMFGTPWYMAPEMIESRYGKPVDWWALGIILYKFLVGKVPFDGDSLDTVLDLVREGDIDWSKVDPPLPHDAQDIITLLLTKDCESRLGTAGGAAEVKAHPFFHGLDWDNLLNQEVTQLEEMENTTQSISDHLSADESSSSPSLSSEYDEFCLDIPDFCRLANRFKEVYKSQELMSFYSLCSGPPSNDQVEEEQSEDQDTGCEEEAHPLCHSPDSNILSQEVLQLEDEEEDTAQSISDYLSSDESSSSHSGSSEDEEWYDAFSDVCSFTSRFKKACKSQEHRSPFSLFSAPPSNDQVEEEQSEDQEQGCEDEAHPLCHSPDSNILSQEVLQLEDEEENTAQYFSDHFSSDESSSCPSGSSEDDEFFLDILHYCRLAHRFKEVCKRQELVSFLSLFSAPLSNDQVEEDESEDQDQGCEDEAHPLYHSPDSNILSQEVLQLEDEEQGCEEEDHPLCYSPDSNILSQEVLQLEDEEENTAQSISDHFSSDESSSFPSGSSEDDDFFLDILHYCRLAHRFKEACKSQELMSFLSLFSAPLSNDQVEEDQLENQDQGREEEAQPLCRSPDSNILSQEVLQLEDEEQGCEEEDHPLCHSPDSNILSQEVLQLEDEEQGCEEEAHPLCHSPDSNILSQEVLQLEDEENTAQYFSDHFSSDESSSCPSGSSEDDEFFLDILHYCRLAHRFKEVCKRQELMSFLSLFSAPLSNDQVEEDESEDQDQGCEDEAHPLYHSPDSNILSQEVLQLEDKEQGCEEEAHPLCHSPDSNILSQEVLQLEDEEQGCEEEAHPLFHSPDSNILSQEVLQLEDEEQGCEEEAHPLCHSPDSNILSQEVLQLEDEEENTAQSISDYLSSDESSSSHSGSSEDEEWYDAFSDFCSFTSRLKKACKSQEHLSPFSLFSAPPSNDQVEEEQSEDQNQGCEEEDHPLCHSPDSNILSQEVLQLEDEEENTAQSFSDHFSSDESSSFPSGSSEDDEFFLDILHYCRLAHRFKEACKSQELMSFLSLFSAPLSNDQVEEEQSEHQDQGCEEEAQPLYRSPDSNILSQEVLQLEDEEQGCEEEAHPLCHSPDSGFCAGCTGEVVVSSTSQRKKTVTGESLWSRAPGNLRGPTLDHNI